MNTIEISNLVKRYRRAEGEVVALDGAGLEAAPGEFVIIQGPSGSGKSTLLLAAGGLLATDSGEVRVCGRDVTVMKPEARAHFRSRNIGFVFQQFHLVPYLNILENILAPTVGLPPDNHLDRADELLTRFNLRRRKYHTPGELSAGEKQRAALARALINQPAVVLADEPTGNLDRANAEIVIAHLADYARSGRTVLLATHDFRGGVRPDRVVGIRDGRTGPPGRRKTRTRSENVD